MLMTKQEMQEMLRVGVRTVTFTKTNGDQRIMRCTLHHSYLPEQTDIEEQIARDTRSDTVAVWDIEKDGWRSFRIDAVTAVA